MKVNDQMLIAMFTSSVHCQVAELEGQLYAILLVWLCDLVSSVVFINAQVWVIF